ncbi:YbgC/FadM family acyl-CoA thioesterase [Parvibaculum sp. MBR-TMA-1.3b-4.2]|jgi:acyl-CoA thioester hydrolase
MSGAETPGWPDVAGCLDGTLHRLPVRVYYEDTDFSGVVYHANYLRFAERGRSDFLRLIGVHHTDLFDGDDPLAFAIHRMEMDFVKPARIDDLLEVRTRYVRASGARIEADQEIVRLVSGDGTATGDGEVLWRAHVYAACIDTTGRPRRLPAGVRAAMAPLIAN